MLITQLWRYPVKSLAGERVDEIRVDVHGLEGDRTWGIEDRATGLFLTARREPRLLLASSSVAGGDVRIILPDGTETTDDAVLSDWLGKPVALVRAPDRDVRYESPSDAEHERDWYTWTGVGSALHDEPYARVSITSQVRLGAWDVRRFRPNVVVDVGDERTLLGERIELGTALLDVKEEISRCVMLTRPQAQLPRDLDVLRAVNREHGGKFSVGALVVKPGRVCVGDVLTWPTAGAQLSRDAVE